MERESPFAIMRRTAAESEFASQRPPAVDLSTKFDNDSRDDDMNAPLTNLTIEEQMMIADASPSMSRVPSKTHIPSSGDGVNQDEWMCPPNTESPLLLMNPRDDAASDDEEIIRPSKSVLDHTIRQEDFHPFHRAAFVSSGALDFHRYLNNLEALSNHRFEVMLLEGTKIVEYVSYDKVYEILTAPLVPDKKENILLLFESVPLTGDKGCYNDTRGYILGYNRTSDALFARYFKKLPETLQEIQELWNEGWDCSCFIRTELTTLLLDSVIASTHKPTEDLEEEPKITSDTEDLHEHITDTANACESNNTATIETRPLSPFNPLVYTYKIPRVSHPPLIESTGIELVILIFFGTFMLDFAQPLAMPPEIYSRLWFVCEEYRNIVERASAEEWLPAKTAIAYEWVPGRRVRMRARTNTTERVTSDEEGKAKEREKEVGRGLTWEEAIKTIYADGGRGDGKYPSGKTIVGDVLGNDLMRDGWINDAGEDDQGQKKWIVRGKKGREKLRGLENECMMG